MVVCPWGQGGGTDRVARQVAALLEQDLGVNVNVLNATGGKGVTGHTQGATAKPDGYTLTIMTVEINMLRWQGQTKLSYRDFTPAVLVNRDPAALFVRNESPWHSLKDLEQEARRAPGTLRASGTAVGGIWHLALSGWLTTAALKASDITWVGSKSAGEGLADLKAKGVDLVCCSLPEAKTLMMAKEIRCLGVMSKDRQLLFPEVASFGEQGSPWTMEGWRGIGLPRNVPRRVLDVIVPALERVAKSERFLAYMKTEGFGPACELPEEFERSIEATDDRMRDILTGPALRSLSQGQSSPMLFPSILGCLLGAVFAALLATGGLRPEATAAAPGGWVRFCEGLLFIAAYALLSNVAGFLLTAAPLLFLALWRLGTRPLAAAPIAAGATIVAYLVFGRLLRVPLPRSFFEG
jgi:tripartite-type tricarboxylate transporter receptor subunit TctC